MSIERRSHNLSTLDERSKGYPAGDFDAPQAFRGRGRHADGAPEFRAARRSLKSALIEKSGATLAEQRRIAAILERAAAEIRGGTGEP